ncbi:unnamed protein product [Caenorhabditis auriculariae]|uniref:Uncharacterized protein n=1 Tax=Caenorhabditis auriculariae TaxID=2777116 RepID=A0A8S1HVX6_9PELO|nr:unnamed protein product [Caenorhabditis auriculariae]
MTFASHYYWSGPKSTQQNLVAFESGGEICFGRIGAIAKLLPCDEVLVSVEKLGLADPKKLIFDYLDSSTQQSSDILKAVLTRYITGPACFCGEIAKDFNGFAIVPLDSIISTAAIIPLMNKNYYFAIPNKRCWQ